MLFYYCFCSIKSEKYNFSAEPNHLHVCFPFYALYLLLFVQRVCTYICVCVCLCVCVFAYLSACLCRYGRAHVSPGPPRPSLRCPFPPAENFRHTWRALPIRYRDSAHTTNTQTHTVYISEDKLLLWSTRCLSSFYIGGSVKTDSVF